MLKPHHLLCSFCFQQIEWIDYRERCRRCLGPKGCQSCLPLYPHRSLFQGEGPILDLYQEFLKTKRGKGLASLITFALARDIWPLPEVIVPLVDRPFPKQDPLWSLAKELAAFLQARPLLPGGCIENKIVLVLVGALWNVEGLIRAKRALAAGFPERLFTLALIDQRK